MMRTEVKNTANDSLGIIQKTQLKNRNETTFSRFSIVYTISSKLGYGFGGFILAFWSICMITGAGDWTIGITTALFGSGFTEILS